METSAYLYFMKYLIKTLLATGSILAGLFFIPGQAQESAHALAKEPENYISTTKTTNCFTLSESGQTAPLVVSNDEFPGVIRITGLVQEDLQKVTTYKPDLIVGKIPGSNAIIIVGTLGKSSLIEELVKQHKIDVSDLIGKWESSLMVVVDEPFTGVGKALVIAGSDKRGTIFGLLELSRNLGVSPWYWWADVPVRVQKSLYVRCGRYVTAEPKVKYRGIFLNDEVPALSGWSRTTFGGFNHKFYEKVFELILRLKGNFLWPAMWGSAFFDDDPLNGPLADEYGIVIGTSHHEPMGRAHDEWRRYGSGPWDYRKNSKVLAEYWKGGVERIKNWETLVTIGMRGDGDEPMSEESNIAVLEKIVRDQRSINIPMALHAHSINEILVLQFL